jgi:glycosyltransferase involved in cell wall biosynthesis
MREKMDMKVLHINSYYSGSSFYKGLYDKQKQSGLDFAVYVPVSTAIDASALKLGDYTTVSTNHGKYDRAIFHIKHKKISDDIVKRYAINEFSIVHAHSLFSNGYIALKLKRDFGIPYIVAVRDTDVNVFFKHMIHLRKLGIDILKEAGKVIFLSPAYRDMVIEKYVPDQLKKEIFDKIEIIPNGINDFWLQNKGTPKTCPEKTDLRLIHAGVINKRKNPLTTVKAIELLKQKGFDVKYTVVGRIEDKSIYQQLADLDYVNYIEPKSKEELIGIFRENHIFVMPSVTETFGLVYAEAMSQGLPVIYSKGQGFDRQFEEGEAGYHVGCFDAEDVADKIIKVVDNYRVISENCTEKCAKFDWNKINSEYTEIYNDVSNITWE